MDHKVSKDMISSGMIPSGEKTQADLGRTQYGSAPSPSSLMDAYKSMYEKKEEVINEHHQKDKDGNTIPHEDEINEMAGVAKKTAQRRGMTAKATGGPRTATSTPQGNPSSVMGKVSQGLSSASQAAGRADKAIASRGGFKKMGTDYLKKNKSNIKGALLGKTAAGTAARIGGAYVAGRMMGGEKKDSGGYDGYKNMQNFHYVPDGDTLSEDLFDALKSALIEEGCDEKNAMKIMASVTPDYLNEIIQEENIDEVVFTGTAMLGGLLAKKLLGAAALKGLKTGATMLAKKAAVKTMGMGARPVLKTIAKKGVGAGMDQAAGMAIKGGVKSMVKNPVNTALATSMVMPQGGPKPEATQRGVTSGKRTAGTQRLPVAASIDLFDVVKGQLLDEGLTEEECTEVMTTLTLDEIQESIGKMKLLPTAALLGGTAVATQQIASRMGKKSGEESIKPKKPNPIKDLIPNLKKKKEATEKSIQSM